MLKKDTALTLLLDRKLDTTAAPELEDEVSAILPEITAPNQTRTNSRVMAITLTASDKVVE